MNEVAEVVLDRVCELLQDLKDDDAWVSAILDIAESDDKKAVKATLSHLIRVIENEF